MLIYVSRFFQPLHSSSNCYVPPVYYNVWLKKTLFGRNVINTSIGGAALGKVWHEPPSKNYVRCRPPQEHNLRSKGKVLTTDNMDCCVICYSIKNILSVWTSRLVIYLK
jgi:hypothetical protein